MGLIGSILSSYGYLPLVLLAMIVSAIASLGVKLTFNKYNKISVGRGIDSNRVAEMIFGMGNVRDGRIMRTSGSLTDNYNPKNKTLNLSDSTYGQSTIGAIGVAAHEAGHAVQHAQNYAFMGLRSAMVPVVNIGSRLGLIIAVIGLFIGPGLVTLGIVLYSATFIFTLVTLPVEFNASRRAISYVKESGYFTDDEVRGMKKVLKAAAMTYVAAMFSSLVSLLRVIAIFGGNRSRK